MTGPKEVSWFLRHVMHGPTLATDASTCIQFTRSYGAGSQIDRQSPKSDQAQEKDDRTPLDQRPISAGIEISRRVTQTMTRPPGGMLVEPPPSQQPPTVTTTQSSSNSSNKNRYNPRRFRAQSKSRRPIINVPT